MLHAHKIIENTDAMLKTGGVLEHTPEAAKDIEVTKRLLGSVKIAGKFDLGSFTVDDANELAYTGTLMCDEGLATLPFPPTYFEVEIRGDYPFRCGVLLTPTDYIHPMPECIKELGWAGCTVYDKRRMPSPWLFQNDAIYYNSTLTLGREGVLVPNLHEDQGLDAGRVNLTVINNVFTMGIALLATSGTSVSKTPAPTKLNNARKKKKR